MTVTLKVAPRSGSAATVRANNKIPAIVYGPKQAPISIEVDAVAFEKMMHQAGESTIIQLEGLDETVEVLIHDVAFNAARGGAEHADFYAIERGKELTTNVPLEFIGEAPAEKSGGIVNKALHEIEVTCKPSKLPNHIDVDLSQLVDEESQILVSDLTIPEGVTVDLEGDTPVATVAAAREEETDDSEPAEVDMDAIEVEKKGKDESDNNEE